MRRAQARSSPRGALLPEVRGAFALGVWLVLVGLFPFSAAGASQTPPADLEQAAGQLGVLAKMWGHLEASRANARAGEWALATLHAGHPVVEYWAIIERPLAQKGLARDVRSALDRYLRQVERQDPNWLQGHEAAVGSLRRAMQALAGPAWGDPRLAGQVIDALLEAVEGEYAEAVESGRLVHLPEYQDAWGFFQVARALYGSVSGAVRAASPEAFEAITGELETLQRIFAGVRPAEPPVFAERVGEATGEIRAELARALKLAPAGSKGPEQAVAEIREALLRTLAEHRQGHSREAYELAVGAYLEGFELMEAELLRRGQRELVEQLELKFKGLRDGVRAGWPAGELEALVHEIDSGLERVLEVLR